MRDIKQNDRVGRSKTCRKATMGILCSSDSAVANGSAVYGTPQTCAPHATAWFSADQHPNT